MGYTSSSSYDFAAHATKTRAFTAAASHHDAFKARSLDSYLDPSKFQMRESRNSVANPASTPVIFALDVTGSMGNIAHYLAKQGLETFIREVNARKPVSDPHLMFMAFGDVVAGDSAPLQVSQFETDLALVEQLEKLWVVGQGGGNQFESYNLPWHFANFHTSCDAFEKDSRKGYLFTIGDESVPADLTEANLAAVYCRTQEPNATNAQLLEALHSKYHVFHMMIEETGHFRYAGDKVKAAWNDLLGQRAVPVSDHTKLAEIAISLMQVTNGDSAASVASSWSGDTSMVVSRAVSDYALTTTSAGAVARSGSADMAVARI